MDISDLKMVETICTTGSLSRACETLFVSQPTLSKRLAKLEDHLGTKLFHRAPNGLTPTVIASYLVESAMPIHAQISAVERQIERILAHEQGELRIGVGPIIEQVLLPAVLVKLTSRTGKVRFSVTTERAEVLLDQLKSGELDVIAGPFDSARAGLIDDGISAVKLIHERTINVARASHPIFKAKKPKLTDYPYASPPLQGTMQPTLRRGTKSQRLSCDNYTLLKKIALETDYICGGPIEIFRLELDSGKMRVVPNSPTIEWQSACLYKSEALETPLVRLFVDTVVACRDEYLQAQ